MHRKTNGMQSIIDDSVKVHSSYMRLALNLSYTVANGSVEGVVQGQFVDSRILDTQARGQGQGWLIDKLDANLLRGGASAGSVPNFNAQVVLKRANESQVRQVYSNGAVEDTDVMAAFMLVDSGGNSTLPGNLQNVTNQTRFPVEFPIPLLAFSAVDVYIFARGSQGVNVPFLESYEFLIGIWYRRVRIEEDTIMRLRTMKGSR